MGSSEVGYYWAKKIEVTDLSTNVTNIFNSIADAAKEYNLHPSLLSKYCKGNYKRPIHLRYKCKFI